jgi:L-lactate dehydrogenase complex protein LldF
MVPSATFKAQARAALADEALQRALGGLPGGLVARRAAAVRELPEFETLRDEARDIRDRTLADLDLYLEAFTQRAEAAGTIVHWAGDASEACSLILDICRAVNAGLVAKGKSMVTEEIGLNAHLEAAGLSVVETDLGEYLVQIRGETPSHIIAPAIHLTEDDVERDFRRVHAHLSKDRTFGGPADLVAEARAVLREKFLAADVGITGANFLVAETGSAILVTNEGNGDLTQSLPRVHIVVASIDKVVPTLEDAATLLRVLARSATGQEMSAYTTLATGPRRAGDPDGPEACHLVIVDNGRTRLLANPDTRAVLRCIRCGACVNHCPVYNVIGGHPYRSVYAGPIGAALTPGLGGVRENSDLPKASTFCGRCEEVCPVRIPLVHIMRHWRSELAQRRAASPGKRIGLAIWSSLAKRPRLYHAVMRLAVAALGARGRRRGSFSWLPFARGWTRTRDFPAPEGRTFQQLWHETRRGVPR